MGKKRARDSAPQELRLCGSLSRGLPCHFGTECRFSHDVKAFLAAKLPDLGDSCFLFEKYGKCPFGLTCRYGSAHINAAAQTSITREGFVDVTPELNTLSKHLQNMLRKRQYFSSKKAAEALVEAVDDVPAITLADTSVEKPATSTEGSGEIAARQGGQPWAKGTFDISAYPLKEVKLVDFSNKVS